QKVTWSRPAVEGLDVMQVGTEEQPVLAKDGDNRRIDWGYLYVAVPQGQGAETAVAGSTDMRRTFATSGRLPKADDARKPRRARDDWPALACRLNFGNVAEEPASQWLMLAYDDLHSIQYLGENLRPWWRRDGTEARDLLKTAAGQYADLSRRCRAFDAELTADLRRVGGLQYADLCAMAYRQAVAAHKLVAAQDGAPMFFSKECFSNGCIGTVDVAYPASPVFMLLSSDLLKATVEPVLRYAASDRWRFPFAPHDLGRYPKANGQRYGGGETSEERQMPVEECGNMLI
ncbi:MAG: glutaminase domain-containing protein, partial [Planctomycetota bacterium]